jgi:hypothetical protein
MKKLFANRFGYAMAWHAVILSTIAIPFLTLTTEITRALFVNVQIQTAVDAACAAASQAVDIPHFVLTGEVVIDQDKAIAFAMREFSATVANANIHRYSPALTSLNIINNTITQCNASATIQWFLPGVPPMTINVVSSAEAKARR